MSDITRDAWRPSAETVADAAFPSPYCNVWIGSVNTPDRRQLDVLLPSRIKVGRGITVEEALRDAERRIVDGEVDAILSAARASMLEGDR